MTATHISASTVPTESASANMTAAARSRRVASQSRGAICAAKRSTQWVDRSGVGAVGAVGAVGGGGAVGAARGARRGLVVIGVVS
jgi:hypothetical protein